MSDATVPAFDPIPQLSEELSLAPASVAAVVRAFEPDAIIH